jgi:cytochrome c oxidase subunit 4
MTMSRNSTHNTNHIVPLRVYFGVAGALFVLTVVTVAISFVHLGGWNVVVALLVASVKSALVALFFMHLLYDKKIFLVIFLAAIMFLAVFIILTMFDTMRRDDIDQIKAQPINPKAVIYDSLDPGDSKSETEPKPEGEH